MLLLPLRNKNARRSGSRGLEGLIRHSRVCLDTVRIQSDEPSKPHPIDDLTSALDYKASNKVRPPPLPRMDLPRSRSAEEVVTNILYNMPPLSLQPYKK